VRDGILLGEEGLVPKKNKAGDIDQKDFLKKIRSWFDKVLGSPSAGGTYKATTRDKWAGLVLGNWQDENPTSTASVRSWLDKDSRSKWRMDFRLANSNNVKYIDAGHDLWTNALRDAQKAWLDSGGIKGTKEIRVVVNMKLMNSIDLPLTYENRYKKFQVQWDKQIQFHLEAFGNGKKSLTSRVKLYATYRREVLVMRDMLRTV
jgi:hypothetical protein